MLRRKPLIFFILLALVVVFFAAEALAAWPDAVSMFSPPPDHITLNLGKDGNWEINASIVENATCVPTDGSASFPCIQYQLYVRESGSTCNTSGLAAVISSKPYDNSCTLPFEVVWVPDDLKFEPDEKALPNTPGWEWDNITCPLAIGINSTDVTTGTVCLKINRSYYCFPMLVPTCEIPECPTPTPVGASAPSQCVVLLRGDEPQNTQGDQWAVGFDADAYGVPIADSVYYYNDLECKTDPLSPTSTTYDPLQLYSSGGPNQPNVTYTVQIGQPVVDAQAATATAVTQQASNACPSNCYCFNLNCGGTLQFYQYCW